MKVVFRGALLQSRAYKTAAYGQNVSMLSASRFVSKDAGGLEAV